MNISFSTNKWTSLDLHDFMNIASEYKYTGIELHGIGGITDGMLTGMYRKLLEMKLKIPCIDVEADISRTSARHMKSSVHGAQDFAANAQSTVHKSENLGR